MEAAKALASLYMCAGSTDLDIAIHTNSHVMAQRMFCTYLFTDKALECQSARPVAKMHGGSRGGGDRGSGPPLEKITKIKGFFEYWSGSPEKSLSYQDSI